MNELKNNILKKLELINYPGFNRNIISFGLVKDVLISDDDVNIILNVKTDNIEHLEKIKSDIINIIESNFTFTKINIELLTDSNLTESTNNLKPKKIIAFASCKGGVGKSTMSLNVACELAKKYKVGFLDLDIYGPSLPIMINVKTQPEFVDNKLIPLNKYGIDFMSFGFLNNENSPAIWRGPMVSRMTQQFFENVEWGELDYLIIDLPPGTGDIQLTLVQKIQLTGAVIITTPQDLAVADVQKGSDMFKKVNVPLIGVIENMSMFSLTGSIKNYNTDSNIELNINDDKNIVIDDLGNFKFNIDIFKGSGGYSESKRLGVPLLGKICIDPHLSESSDSGTPYVLQNLNSHNQIEFEKISELIADF